MTSVRRMLAYFDALLKELVSLNLEAMILKLVLSQLEGLIDKGYE